MITKTLTATFLTPAFLGDAAQQGCWRTPPFKHLLREFWRMAYAAEHNYPSDHRPMRAAEAMLFGHAWYEGDRTQRNGRSEAAKARQSAVRIRLSQWNPGTLRALPDDLKVFHPEVGKQVGSALYLGYGPIKYGSGKTLLKEGAAIQQGETAQLHLAYPEASRQQIEQALSLAAHFAALGGRCRNGWGSLQLEGAPPIAAGALPTREWRQCLALDWPHALGHDQHGPLLWATPAMKNWPSLMQYLARIKIALRTRFKFTVNARNGDRSLPKGILHGAPQERHWLSYPITNHKVARWGERRLPNTLRFRACAAPDGQLIGMIFHMPHSPPPEFSPQQQDLLRVWQSVHQQLDDPAQQHPVARHTL